MANENTAALISSFINTVWEGALLTAREQSVMSPLVTMFTDRTGAAPRSLTQYSGGTLISPLHESVDMSSQTITPATLSTLTPAMVGGNYFITDYRIESDPFSIRSDAAMDLGQLLAVNVDVALCTDMASFTGGTVGTAGGTITWANVFNAITKLRAAFAPAPYTAVVRPEQWYYLANTLSAGQTVTNAPALQDAVASQWFAGNAYGVDFYVDANITAGTACKAGMFARPALALDWRRAPRIEPQRDASRGGGGWELNLTGVYAHGLWRPTFGVTMVGTSTVS